MESELGLTHCLQVFKSWTAGITTVFNSDGKRVRFLGIIHFQHYLIVALRIEKAKVLRLAVNECP